MDRRERICPLSASAPKCSYSLGKRKVPAATVIEGGGGGGRGGGGRGGGGGGGGQKGGGGGGEKGKSFCVRSEISL